MLKSPFPYFGGKSQIAQEVWKYFGQVQNYVEPFFGSGACLLNRPLPFVGNETVNDADGLVCNFWRAVQVDPDAVAKYADWPANENDLHARHAWLVERKESFQAKLEGDPDFFDAKVAGWWVWGMACWFGGGFCSGDGPWVIKEVDGVRQLVNIGGTEQGVVRRLLHLGAGRGVSRRRVHLYGRGQGDEQQANVEAKSGSGERGLLKWMQALAERLRRVRVCCGDWTRVCGGVSGNALVCYLGTGKICAIFLDPPYSIEANRSMGCYRVDSGTVAHAVREWAIAHGDDKRLRIALCGYVGEHDMPASWKHISWKARGGMANLSKGETRGKDNSSAERVWFSPHCTKPNKTKIHGFWGQHDD